MIDITPHVRGECNGKMVCSLLYLGYSTSLAPTMLRYTLNQKVRYVIDLRNRNQLAFIHENASNHARLFK